MPSNVPDYSENDLLDRFLAAADRHGMSSPEVRDLLREHPQLEEAAKQFQLSDGPDRSEPGTGNAELAPLESGATLGEY